MSPKKQKGDPNAGVWRLARSWRQTHCCYCRTLFTEGKPPTKDHIYPNADRSSGMAQAIVLACQLCNNARGQAPYDEYMEAVAAEWARCDKTGNAYRRPTYRTTAGGGYEISTESKNAANKRKAEARQRKPA